ncbi:ornithine cyclodeaminase family protein [Companilactobacillus sp.]|jgi:ornithine cyclodeaminase|uniref:ornithine cyclodeaminase family protein n=1 Tax=Companilactobacillus sp. TaxID=2767905 RepID=UPI0025BF958B|nr:ornithine cyclodeaminase family protein [Companilactobacillus sp.]MCH4009224.1 ornithine cyclodeaminase family protein [Companilactobacillus sp.]MCH4050597.1 ornithine cyclodeaminase family protein [Companilactobacillus sp.]MCH4077166.1 ornithine cyclodeaminase family protein [Companilactobacillus sp.]MCH4125742.1 ornithine cyclodeaminase family protein [Companilactobacillus sp.]MCI1311451.1 ornithine cyclodeaminase family protein [Companilactobacillus sp.]
MLLLSKADIEKFYTLEDCINAVGDAFRLFSEGKVQVPLRTQIKKHNDQDTFLCMPAFCEEYDASCVKVLNIDAKTGVVDTVMDGSYVTQLRTGAASGVAFKYLAKQNCRKGALIGTGGQAATQLETMLIVRDLEEVQVSDLDYDRAVEFAEKMSQKLAKYGTKITAAKNGNEAVTDADLVISVTPSKQPVYDAEKIKPGATVSGVGSYQPDMEETPVELVEKADKIYFDSKDAVLAEAGDILIPLDKKMITDADFTGDIGEVIGEKVVGRENDDEIIFFKTVGIAAQDLTTAKSIHDKAVEQGFGTYWND